VSGVHAGDVGVDDRRVVLEREREKRACGVLADARQREQLVEGVGEPPELGHSDGVAWRCFARRG
jgi:hypothetical protein